MSAASTDPVARAFTERDVHTLELEARCVLTTRELGEGGPARAFGRICDVLCGARCWDSPPERFTRTDRLYTEGMRCSTFDNGRTHTVRKLHIASEDLPAKSEAWVAPHGWPRFRLQLSREVPVQAAPKHQPTSVRRKDSVSCTYKQQDWRFDVSLVDGARLELEVECQTLVETPENIRRSIVMKLADLVQMAHESTHSTHQQIK